MNIGKKLLSLLTVFCLTLSLIPTAALAATSDPTSVTLGSAQMVQESNITYYSNGSVMTAEPTSWTAKYEPASHTLTLNNYIGGPIRSTGNLIISLNGTNHITSGDNGIYSKGELTINGPGSVTLTSSTNGTTVYAQDTITIQNGAKVTAPGGTSGQSIHLNTDGKQIIITGSGTVVNAIDGSTTGIIRCGLYKSQSTVYTGEIHIRDGAKLQATKIEGKLIINDVPQNLNNGNLTNNEASASTGFKISGTVKDGGKFVEGASVQLAPTDTADASAVISTSTTTESGTYSFSNVPAGNYTITASKEGYSASTGAPVNVTVSNANVTTGTDLTLSLIKYNVYVNGTQVTGINKDNVLSDANQTVKYTPASEDGITPQKLTLNGVNISNTTISSYGIEASNDLTITLSGSNVISGSGHAINMTSGALTITGPGSLQVSSDSGQTTVYTKGDVTINGGAKITATNISGSSGDVFDLGDSNDKHTLTITGNGTQVTAQKTVGSEVAINHISTLTVNDGAMLTAQSKGTAISCTTFSPDSNSSVKVADNYNGTGANDYSNSTNLNSYKYVAVQPKGTTSTTYTVTLTSGTGYTLLAAQGFSSPVTSGGSYSFTLDIADSYKRGNNFAVKANGSELTAGADGQYTISNIRENQTITVEGVVEITKYQVWVNGTQVTEANKDNVLQDNTATHSVVYAPAYGNNPATLTLTNASIKNQQTSQSGELPYILPCGIAAKENLKVIVYGENNIIESANGNAIRGEDDLTICGNGFLQLTSYNTAVTISVQDSHNLAVTENVKITATKKNSNNQLDGRTIAANDVTVQGNANVTAINETNNRAVYCSDKLKVTDSATLIAQSKQNSYAIYTANGFTYPGHIVKASKNSEGNEPDTIYDPAKLTPEGNETAYKYVQVSPTSGTVITGIKFNKELSMKVGATETLTPVFTPTEPSEKTVTWTSSDETVATVEQNGKVTAVGLGTATITVLTKDGGYTDTCTVTVSNSSSSSGSHTTYYPVNTSAKGEGGSVVVSPKSASKGSAVTVTVTPESGYQVSSVQAVDKDGKKLTLTDKGDGKYTFVMPGSKVEVSASFAQVQKPEEPSPYRDVSKDSYYYDAVQWASDKGITNGVADGVFAPDWVCTRGQIVTFLWRSVGSPAPKTAEMPFADVEEDAYYAQAVLWAVENGITKGTSETTFSPNETCTRAHAVAFLYRLAGSPAVTGSSFQDVAADAYYNAAVAWAVQQGITKGTSETTFSPNETCTRAQIVTFLYRMDQAK